MGRLLNELLSLGRGRPASDVRVGKRYTAVKVDDDIGVARSFLMKGCMRQDTAGGGPGDSPPPRTDHYIGRDLTGLLKSEDEVEASIGAAALNARLGPALDEAGDDRLRMDHGNVFDLIVGLSSRYRRIGVVGFFPFIDDILRRRGVGSLEEGQKAGVTVFEKREVPGCLPSSEAEAKLPGCDLVVITGSTLVNRTLEGLLEASGGRTLVIGPSTPLAPLLLERGADLLAGVRAVDDPVLDIVEEGGGTRSFIRRAESLLLTRDDRW